MAADDLTAAAVAKRLASCNRATRDRALRLLRPWLTSSCAASDEDLLKVWKGLFYCVWHADKPHHQLDLSRRLSSLLTLLPTSLSPRFLSSFLSTLRREWSAIDHLRLDKFYTLLRLFVHHSFAFLRLHRWDPSLVHAVSSAFAQRSLLSADRYPAAGVNYHISQVFLQEIVEFLPLQFDTLDSLLKPFVDVMRVSSDKTLVAKVKANVFERLLESGNRYLSSLKEEGTAPGGSDESNDVEELGKIALLFAFSKRFFDMASLDGTVQSSRKLLFDLHKRFSKLERDLERSGIRVEWPATENVEVPAPDGAGEMEADSVVDNCNDLGERPAKKRRQKNKKGYGTAGKKSVKREDVGKLEAIANGSEDGSANDEKVAEEDVAKDDEDSIAFDEIVLSNLQKQFEMVAAEEGMGTPVVSARAKKRKRVKSTDRKVSSGGSKSVKNTNEKTFGSTRTVEDGIVNGKMSEKSAKRVRFSMKNNLVWKPHSPLPPHSLRLPPSATPRGSALKKGVPPGPVEETTPRASKKVKVKVKTSSLKKVRRSARSASPGVKRVRKLQNSIQISST